MLQQVVESQNVAITDMDSITASVQYTFGIKDGKPVMVAYGVASSPEMLKELTSVGTPKPLPKPKAKAAVAAPTVELTKDQLLARCKALGIKRKGLHFCKEATLQGLIREAESGKPATPAPAPVAPPAPQATTQTPPATPAPVKPRKGGKPQQNGQQKGGHSPMKKEWLKLADAKGRATVRTKKGNAMEGLYVVKEWARKDGTASGIVVLNPDEDEQCPEGWVYGSVWAVITQNILGRYA